MDSLEGTYKSNFNSFSIKITKESEEFSFWQIVPENKDIFLYKGKLIFNTGSQNILIYNDDLRISPQLGYSDISIDKFPKIGFIGNYSRL